MPAPTGNRLLEIQRYIESDANIKNYNDMQKYMNGFLVLAGWTEIQFKAIHFTRNKYQNSDVNYDDISAPDSGFKKLPPEKSIFHQIGAGNENNEKWTNDKGEEYVFNPSTNPPKLVTNATNIGTYNFIPESDLAGHYLLDVLPYLLWGNSESDPTTFEERFRLYEKAKDETALIKKAGLGIIGVYNAKWTANAVNMKIKKLKKDGIPLQVVARLKKIQADKDIENQEYLENLVSKTLLAPSGNTSLDYKTLDDSEFSKRMLDRISDNAQENIDAKKIRFSIDPINQRQKEEQNTQSFNDDQRIKTVNLAVKQRQEEQQRIKLLSGNYAFGTIIGGNFSRNSESQSGFIGVDTTPSVDGNTVDRYLFGYARNILPVIRNGNSISIGLSFDNLKESGPSNSSGNASLVSSDRVRARSGDYGDYSYIAWGSWTGGENTRFRNYDRIRGGHWIYGQRLGTVDIPKSGSARYIGQVRGDYVHRGRATVEMNSITGDINMTVTFRDGNNSLSGAMNLDRNGTHWARTRFNTQNARFSSGSNIFKTSLKVQGGGRGQLRGSFFGANAAEAGGSFAVNKDGIATGVFRAKKQ